MWVLTGLDRAESRAVRKHIVPLRVHRGCSCVRRSILSQAGSTLIWVMVVILVLVLALGVGLAAASGRFNLSATRHEQQQAYYTALSSTQAIADWVIDTGDESVTRGVVPPGSAVQLLEALDNAEGDSITIFEEDLPEEVGTCTVSLQYVDAEQRTLKITSTATYAGATETVSLTLQRRAAGQAFEGELSTTDFTPLTYTLRAEEINGITSGGVVPLYEKNSDNNSNKNQTDLTALNTAIPNAESTKEARWTNVDVTATSGSHNAGVLGTQRYPINGQSDSDTDNRRFMVPVNGRIMIDPLEDGGAAEDSESSVYNTKISSLSIDNTAGKNVLFRLASGSAATANGAPNNRSDTYRNSLLLFNFTDNAGSSKDLKVEVPGKTSWFYTAHPDKWNSLDVYVQSNSQVTSNILLGPFGHKYDSYLDYRSFGNFVDNWHGITSYEYTTLWPYVSASTNGDKYLGMPVFPADYGEDAHFWILDGRTDRYFRVMQGVNIIEGSIYSNRPTRIGGGLLRDSTGGKTKEKVNENTPGYSLDSSYYYTLYVDAVVRYDQLIYNTDIILMGPSSTVSSVIQRPYTWEDRPTGVYLTPDQKDKEFYPTMTIKGGTIYVGARQSLTIEGTIKSTQGTKAPLDNMWIAPDQIVVDGGELIIQKSDTTNVLTNIYVVNNGRLVIEKGAKIKGNIYAYDGGTVDIRGSFTLDSPNSNPVDQEYDGIFIYGEDTKGTNGITDIGHLVVPTTPPISGLHIDGDNGGNAVGSVHLVGGDWADLTNVPDASLALTDAGQILCSDYDPVTGRCRHFDGGGGPGGNGGWAMGSFGDG